MLRSVGAYILSVALAATFVLVGSNAFRQLPNELASTEPGSLLFGVLQLVIGTSSMVAAVGVLLRASWASRSIGIGGVAAGALLVSQPLFEPMPPDAQWAIWLGAALVGAAAAILSWCARRLAKPAPVVQASTDPARIGQPLQALLPDPQPLAEPILVPAPGAQVPRVAAAARHDDSLPASGPPKPR